MRSPRTAAEVSARTASSGSRWTRWRSTSRMPSGTGSAAGSHAARGRAGRRAAGRTAARRKGSHPSRRRRSRPAADRAHPPSVCSSAPTGWRRARRAGRARHPRAPGRPSCPPGSRSWSPPSYAGCSTTATGAWIPTRPGGRSSWSDVASAQWMSSRTSSSGCAVAARARVSTTASNIRRPVPPPSAAHGGAAVEQWREQGVELTRALIGQRADDAQPRPQCGRVVTLVAASDEHPEAGGLCVRPEVGDEPRLADAGLAGNQQEAHRAGRARRLE